MPSFLYSFKDVLVKIYIILNTFVLIFLIQKVYFSDQTTLEELTVKKINIVGEDKSLRIVLSNETRQHPGIIDGKELSSRKRPAGIIFFNNEGDESGGIISAVYKDNGNINSGMSFTMDQYKNDQVIQILNNEILKKGKKIIQRGFQVNEFPEGAKYSSMLKELKKVKKIKDENLKQDRLSELMRRQGAKKRIYLGRTFKDESGLFLYDKDGKLRLKIYLDRKGIPSIEYSKNGKKIINLLK